MSQTGPCSTTNNNDDGFNNLRICRSTLDKLAPHEKRSGNDHDCNSSSNNAPFINKTLSLSVKGLRKGQK